MSLFLCSFPKHVHPSTWNEEAFLQSMATQHPSAQPWVLLSFCWPQMGNPVHQAGRIYVACYFANILLDQPFFCDQMASLAKIGGVIFFLKNDSYSWFPYPKSVALKARFRRGRGCRFGWIQLDREEGGGKKKTVRSAKKKLRIGAFFAILEVNFCRLHQSGQLRDQWG